MNRRLPLLLLFAALLGCAAPPIPLLGTGPVLEGQTPRNLTLAFIGDQGVRNNSRAVLELIKAEGAQAVVHQGDFDYRDDPALWEQLLNGILGAEFPYFASVGNHDEDMYYGPGGYQEYLAARMRRLGIPWEGDLGVQSVCSFQGILLVFTAPGVFGEGDGFHERYIREQLAREGFPWRISSWHKNMTPLQTGRKWNEAGWGVYEESRRGGAIVATGHEHSYSRTHLLKSCRTQEVASREETLALQRDDPRTEADEGRTFVFVSGIGGKSIRHQVQEGEHWACIYTSDQDAAPGALFGVFHYEGDPHLARFYFKDIRGRVVDEFLVRSPAAPD